MPRLVQFGLIVWVDIADANGIRKLRPAVIVTPNDRITPTPCSTSSLSLAGCPSHCPRIMSCSHGMRKGIRAQDSTDGVRPSVPGWLASGTRIFTRRLAWFPEQS